MARLPEKDDFGRDGRAACRRGEIDATRHLPALFVATVPEDVGTVAGGERAEGAAGDGGDGETRGEAGE